MIDLPLRVGVALHPAAGEMRTDAIKKAIEFVHYNELASATLVFNGTPVTVRPRDTVEGVNFRWLEARK